MPQHHYNIKVDVDSSCGFTVTPDPLYVTKQDEDLIHWHTHDGELSIDLNESPFHSKNKNFHGHVHDNVPQFPEKIDKDLVLGGHRKSFKYKITVEVPNQKPCVYDPQIIIDDGSDQDQDEKSLSGHVLPGLAVGAGLALIGWGLSRFLRQRG